MSATEQAAKRVGGQLTVGVGATLSNGRVLLARRDAPGTPEYHENWELPGGKIEFGEEIEKTIEREVLEETGVRVSCRELLPFSYTNLIKTTQGLIQVLVVGGLCETLNAPESLNSRFGAQWFSLDEIPLNYVIPGSKEFLIWLLRRRWSAHVPERALLYRIDLQAVEASDNRYRHYSVSVSYEPDYERPYCIRREWGRIGRRVQSETEWVSRFRSALLIAQKHVETRRRHGYSITFLDRNHPLRSWIQDSEFPVENAIQPPLF